MQDRQEEQDILIKVPLSLVMDRWRRSKLVSIISIVWSVAGVFSGFCINFGQLLATRAVVGRERTGSLNIGSLESNYN